MTHLTEEQEAQLQQKLIQELKELEHRLQQNKHFGQEESFSDSIGELSLYDNHPADIASEEFERGKDLALNEHAEHHIKDIKKALHHLNSGNYGVCIVCGKPIPFARLEAVPYTLYCKDHAPDSHVSDRRPVEEKIMSYSLERIRDNELTENPSPVNGEDTWQEVSHWGNSDTPALSANQEFDEYDEYTDDEQSGYVESLETFLATDIYGKDLTVLKNAQYQSYVDHDEGDNRLTIEAEED
jgi:YteA family regulatory protein